MSKGLEALERIKSFNMNNSKELSFGDFRIIEKELKALEIIKGKCVDVPWFYISYDIDRYNSLMDDSRKYLTQEEYDLLKEVLL